MSHLSLVSDQQIDLGLDFSWKFCNTDMLVYAYVYNSSRSERLSLFTFTSEQNG